MSFLSAQLAASANQAQQQMARNDPDAAAPPYPQSPDPTLPDPKWLEGLESHPIFSGTAAAHTTNHPHLAQHSTNPRLMAVRNTDLILAANGEVRIASLLDAKASVKHQPMSPSPSTSSSGLSYKVLEPTDPAHIDWEIRHLLVNPTGKLLAVVGEYTVTLLVLPRSGYSKQVGGEIASRSVPVAPYYHSVHGLNRIAKVQWHPWGEAGTSLLVLTDDGLLREYDVSRDTEEPQQVVSLLPRTHTSGASHLHSRSRSATPTAASLAASIYSSPVPFRKGQEASAASPSRSRAGTPGIHSSFGLTADDDDSRIAVSFTLCITQTSTSARTMFDDIEDEAWASKAKSSRRADDWSAFTVLGLMKNGDVWAICPFMPRNAMVPPSYIHLLSRLTTLKLSATDGSQAEGGDAELESEMRLRFLNALLKQVGDKSGGQRERSASRARSAATPGPDRASRYRSTSAMDLDRLSALPDGADPAADDALDVSHDIPIRLHPPSWAFAEEIASSGGKNAPRAQGPFLLRPAPVELCDERESAACDIAWSWLDRLGQPGTSQGSISGLGIVALVGHDGRVDVGVLLEPVEPKWGKGESRQRAARKSAKPVRTNRYGLSDTEDEGDESVALDFDSLTLSSNEALPTLLMYETIDLGLLDSVMESSKHGQSESSDVLLDASARNRPCFVADPLYRDTLYVYHALGAQCLGFARWAGKLIDVLNLPSEEDLELEQQDGQQGREKALTKLLHHGETTEVVWIVKTVTAGEASAPSMNPIVAVCILSDVYLSYSFMAVTQDLQLVALELSLRIDTDDLVSRGAAQGPRRGTAADAATRPDRPRAYVSLLGDGTPFTPPALFNQSGTLKGLPSQPRRAAAGSGDGSSSSSELQVTPDTLRQLGKTVEGYRVEIRDVVQAGNAVQARLDLQVREMTRMLDKLDAIRKRCERVSGAGGLDERLRRIRARQHELTRRTDKALQKLMDRHQPSLSIYEKRWFDELGRIAKEVGVVADGKADKDGKATTTTTTTTTTSGGGGLKAKSELLQHHLNLLRPSLQQMVEEKQKAARAQQRQVAKDTFSQEANVASGGGAGVGGMGREQLRRVEMMLGSETRLLTEAKAKILELNARIAKVQMQV
ncbi:uncharacterized protein PFL1_03593 [Pseudozyma flocculosa PF-1]|uniref:Nucleoporin Nup82 n=1 Tax=Pseudozyma flocculosa PF-1 TaxID=1277687 RepID=A0A061H9T9_9BASI|nr:uncharacterized protein PFL1_03593 [Pseudozyma flocculosa PF-1]EPQ28790.1 hypothetical protein PFL1_03593 [Pseudozyma flocculosa PF-1]